MANLMSHQNYLLKALALAEKGQGFCSPNPAVGAVVVDQGKIIAEGYHKKCGEPHAEQRALKKLVGQNLAQATLYVTLTPCCHWGRTPPCTDEIIRSGIKHVVFAYADVNPKVSRDHVVSLLAQAGILCEQVSVPDIDQFYKPYAYWSRHGMPFVNAKIAQSLDGKIAHANGKPIAISGKEAEVFTHQNRLRNDLLMTTATTVLFDAPSFTARLGDTVTEKPLVILDARCRLTGNEKVFSTTTQQILFYQAGLKVPVHGPRCRYIAVDADANGRLDLHQVLKRLGELGYHQIWLEVGGQCLSGFLSQRLVNRLFVYIAPMWLGQQTRSVFPLSHDLRLSEEASIAWQPLGKDALARVEFNLPGEQLCLPA